MGPAAQAETKAEAAAVAAENGMLRRWAVPAGRAAFVRPSCHCHRMAHYPTPAATARRPPVVPREVVAQMARAVEKKSRAVGIAGGGAAKSKL